MNTLKIFPTPLRNAYIRNVINAGIELNPGKHHSNKLIVSFFISLALSDILYFLGYNFFLIFFFSFIVLQLFFYFRLSLMASSRIKRIETAFPDVIQLMSSNLRAGMTVDRAFLLSARPEFHPLDQEILKIGKDIATGKDTSTAFKAMSKRVESEKIEKTINLIISGLKAGGNISTLLEQTASNIREKEFIEKRAASNILMYIIFIFIAVSLGAPILFGLSSILTEIILRVVSGVPEASVSQMSLPITFKSIDLSMNFVIYFSLIFLIVTDIISCLVIGLVNKGDEKYGLKYLIPMLALSIGVFFAIRIFLYKFIVSGFSF